MPSRAKRALIAFTVLASGLVYLKGATHFEQQAITAQAPAVATAPAVARYVDREQLIKDLRALSDPALEGRRTGTPGGLKARAWVEAQFAATGLVQAGSSGYQQPFEFVHRSVRGLLSPGRSFRTTYSDAANVIGKVDGTTSGARAIVVSAHYDHLGVRDDIIYPGADDNASGVAVLLAIARQLRTLAPRHPVLFVAFDAEELGLRGAEALVGSSLLPVPAVALNVNLDMVSRNDDNEIFAAGAYHTPWLKPILEDVQRRSAVKILFGHDRPMVKAGGVEDWTSQSDHGVFHQVGVPFVYFGVEDHADYHQPSDTADKIRPRFFGDVADMIVEAVVTLDREIP